jgi:hypothetical protein
VFFWPVQFERKENVYQRRNSTKKGENDEKNAIEHSRISSGIVCMGANDAAAAHE